MNCTIRRIIYIKEAISYQTIGIINKLNENIENNCKYSWSTDSICWTNWNDINTYNKICKNLDSDFYLRILITDTIKNIVLNGHPTNCYNICVDNSNIFLQDFCGDVNIFQPYNNLDCAIKLQQQISDSVTCMFGIPIFYFKLSPNVQSADYTFKEYVLYNVTAMKQLKLIIPDGNMPSSNPKLTEFDFEWETSWETEISKSAFAKAFGDNACPYAKDLIYIPLMKRMWEVNAAYDPKEEGLMWQSTTWKLQLAKYNDGTNVDNGIFDDIIDSLTMNTYENVFGELERNEQERETGTLQMSSPRFAATNLFNIFMEDAVRKQYTKNDIHILDKLYNHRANIVARNIYKFKNENGCITYQKPICGDSGTLMFILETPGSMNESIYKDILNFGEICAYMNYDKNNFRFYISFNNMTQMLDQFSTYMVILKWNRATHVSEMNIYKYKHNSNVPIYKLRPEMYYFDFENPICEQTGEYNNDFDMRSPQECQIHSFPVQLANIKYYNKYLEEKESIKESCKYTTNHDNCVICDLVRPLDSGHGYAVR